MAGPNERQLVSDLTLIMRTRLICGQYSSRAVPPRWRGVARTYCVVLGLAYSLYMYIVIMIFQPPIFPVLHWALNYGQYLLVACFSLWTGEEYLYEFFTRNTLTDVTLDSSMIFHKFQRQINISYIAVFVLYFIYCVISMTRVMNLMIILVLIVPTLFLHLLQICTCITKCIVMGLFNTRLLILRRRLERYGFRTIGRAPPQPYCQIYDEIWRGLESIDNPFKPLLLIDLIFSTSRMIVTVVFTVNGLQWQDNGVVEFGGRIIYVLVMVSTYSVLSFGHVALLESADAHCDAMAVFTVTQLIKTPTAEERRRMYEFLRALERRGAHYRMLRALPLDAALVLRVLGFCSAQVIVIFNMAV